MDPEELRALLSTDGLRLLDEVGALGAEADVVRTVSRLRAAGHPPALVAAVLTQARLRTRARARFGDFADRMLFTPDGLEQATRLPVAAHHAGRFARAGLTSVADLGCGIGADAMAFAGLGLRVVAVERDEVTAALAAYNLAPFPDARVVHGDALDEEPDDVDGLWFDPARRSGGRRTMDPADWSPPLDAVFARAAQRPTGVKLGPAIDHALIPDGVEAQWVSADRDVVELVVWSGRLARDQVGRSALVIGAGGTHEITAPEPSPDAETGALGDYLLEPDGAVIRARLIGEVARRVNGRMIDPSIAWITGDIEPQTPFGQSFRVRETLPFDERKLKAALRERRIGTLEIKKRGVDVDPAALRTRLAPRGDETATLVLTRVGGVRTAVLADRIP
ncbi:class I SAM-dependent methyltransferase [Homoserinibacter sp. GY 40078]|uniref:class I SAM-dependent methyltransferase n=1 Tax=Homoserinibacter sp. GY 40078 TaxID=2603275 RepID=UPI0011C95A06|nr:class I SAM-dependent methyltransferase [Homoserinibacter sp. GY 40078]TXK19210.1 class I SAM-dependent methyltransferase [Homoserinibacter sp. GY 40078]